MIPLRCPVRRRLVLLGESAAAGYLLAPHLTPAMALQARLGPDVDVVDLARTNERLESLLATAQAAMQLQPDVLVVFAGNNWNLLETPQWSPGFPDDDARRAVGAAVRAGGLLGPAQAAWSTVATRAERVLDELASLGSRLLVVVPEVNLLDWPARQPTPWLSGEDTAHWHAADAAEGDEGQLAEQQIALDGGSTPTGFARLGRAALAQGAAERAELALRAAVDADRYATMACLSAPRAGPSVQALLRRNAAEVVDLPLLFSKQGRGLPGRELFLDYCHLTEQGVHLTADAIAQTLGWPVTDAEPPRVTAQARIAAFIGAAVHGVHRGLEGEPVRFWLQEALRVDEGRARAALGDLVAARLAPLPAVLSPGQLAGHGLSPQHGWRWPWLDAEVLAAIGDVGVALPTGPERVEPWTPLDGFLADAMVFDDLPRRAAVRAAWPVTRLALFGGSLATLGAPQKLKLVVRGSPGQLRARIGACSLGSWSIGPSWSEVVLPLPAGTGLRQVDLLWPMPPGPGEVYLEAAVKRLEAGLEGLLHPSFGELYSAARG